ncbi:hypothetical protein PX554_06575 [Sphingomonas sp. H39-1-10]|uniref:hypothetical protein n=1 Tax=Sphingomonas TaxID=13687 RepID=UPI000891B055|nr:MULTISPECIES: hypothetical protein [Sphingomonas]MDF0487788.1 hypothetical protein [Sphingomonas pollutisoli]SDA25880.1 solute carrier family 6 (neurotransmitter transporter, GABA) member 1 [Sphingomonas sp. NFR15]
MRKSMIFAAAAFGLSTAALAQTGTGQTSPNGYPAPGTTTTAPTVPASPPTPSGTMPTTPAPTDTTSATPADPTGSTTTATPSTPSPVDSAPDGTPVKKKRR